MKRIFLFIVIAFLFSGCAHAFAKGPWSGRVIDAETKEPIEGAVVVAVWEEDYAAAIQRGRVFRDAAESLTNSEGYFEIEARTFLPMLPDGKIVGPKITIFKPGYGYYPRFQISPRRGTGSYFDKPNSVVELPKLHTKEERLKNKPDKHTPNVEDEHKIKLFIHLLNIERKDLGLETYEEPK